MNCRISKLLLNLLSLMLAIMGIVTLSFITFVNEDTGLINGFTFLTFQSEYIYFDWAIALLGIASCIQIASASVFICLNLRNMILEKYNKKVCIWTIIATVLCGVLYVVEGAIFFIFDEGKTATYIPLIIVCVISGLVVGMLAYMKKFTVEELTRSVVRKGKVGIDMMVEDKQEPNFFMKINRPKTIKWLVVISLLTLALMLTADILFWAAVSRCMRIACVVTTISATILNLQEKFATTPGSFKEKMGGIKMGWMAFSVVFAILGAISYLLTLMALPDSRILIIIGNVAESLFAICMLFALLSCGISIFLQIRYNYGDNKRIWKMVTVVLCAAVCVAGVVSAWSDSGISGKDTRECSVCHKEFDMGTSNSKSIISSGMCDRCLKNFKWGTGRD